MDILFISLINFQSLRERNIYTDLLREFEKKGHNIYVVSPVEKREKKKTQLIKEKKNVYILKVRIGNIQKTNLIEKGLTMLTVEKRLQYGIDKYFNNVKFDLALYTTPPITINNIIRYIKKRDNAITYLMLKDIFPQNAIDLGLLNKKGIKGLIYTIFRKKEIKLYKISDYIGCMSQKNIEYLLENNPYIDQAKVEICPNSIEPRKLSELTKEEVLAIKEKYCIPEDRYIYIYGGNLGKPQGLEFLIRSIKRCKDKKIFFIIVGDGTEYKKIADELGKEKLDNYILMKQLPKKEFETLVQICNVGLVFLDKRFSIPNIPSRILSYMEVGIPILAATDINTDLKEIIQNNELGYWCENGDEDIFLEYIKLLKNEDLRKCMGKNARRFLEKNYTSEKCCTIIEKHFSK